MSSLVEMAGDEVAEDKCEVTPAWDCGWELRYSSSVIKGRLIALLRCISRFKSWSLAEPQRFQEKRRLTLPDSRYDSALTTPPFLRNFWPAASSNSRKGMVVGLKCWRSEKGTTEYLLSSKYLTRHSPGLRTVHSMDESISGTGTIYCDNGSKCKHKRILLPTIP